MTNNEAKFNKKEAKKDPLSRAMRNKKMRIRNHVNKFKSTLKRNEDGSFSVEFCYYAEGKKHAYVEGFSTVDEAHQQIHLMAVYIEALRHNQPAVIPQIQDNQPVIQPEVRDETDRQLEKFLREMGLFGDENEK